MKIVYVAKHAQLDSADDEGAIAFALQTLGHEVRCLPESTTLLPAVAAEADLLLFHKWGNADAVRRSKCRKAFWFFDLVELRDPTTVKRNRQRLGWMDAMLPLVDLGFCTDGDWVEAARLRSDGAGRNAHKLVWLPQGADERIVGKEENEEAQKPILFTGDDWKAGRARETWLLDVRNDWQDRLTHHRHGIYRGALRREVAGHKIVLAPDAPLGARYWSNRIYTTLGFGGFLLHPWNEELARHYQDREEVLFYRSRPEMHSLIDDWLSDSRASARRHIGENALARTKKEHLYRHRVERLLKTVEERLK